MSKRFYGQRMQGPTEDGRILYAGVFNEVEVRIAAGITMAMGAIVFALANWEKVFAPIQVVTTFFFIEFLIRVTVGFHRSPVGIVSSRLTRGQPPQWVSAKPKRFAWTLGMIMSFSMMVITNAEIRGVLPRTICLICLALMWLESVLGMCLGCEVHGFLVRLGWTTKDEEYEICAGGVCAIPDRGDAVTQPLVAATAED
ncbi:MAG: DUF4395 domain-containing protein [Acidimicrobiales bacterium]